MLDNISFAYGGLFSSEGNWMHPATTIPTTELIVMIKGQAHLAEQEQEFHLSCGQYVLFEPNKLHCGIQETKEEVSFYWFHFNGRLPKNFMKQSGSFGEKNRVELLCKQLLHYANTPSCYQEAKDYCLRLLLLEIELQARQETNGTVRFSEICEWIRLHADKPLTCKQAAMHFDYHEDYLARLFRKNLNCSLKQYIIQMRIAYLKEQLLSTNLSLKEIAYMAGFQEYKYFLKFFTMYEHMTPTEYRNIYFHTHKNKD